MIDFHGGMKEEVCAAAGGCRSGTDLISELLLPPSVERIVR